MNFLKKIPGIYVERKKRTKFVNIEIMSNVKYVRLPLENDLKKLVSIGDYVKKGQVIARGVISPTLHSPISGEVEKILEETDNRGKLKELILIKNDFNESMDEELAIKPVDELTIDDFLELIKEKGIVGMGGGAYPTYLKLKKANENKVKTLVVNACECEPYLTCDERLMQEKAKEIIEGINILIKMLDLKSVIIAVEDNKKESILELKKAVKVSKVIEVRELKRKYPLGEERILIEALFHKEISKEEFPINKGYLIQNIGTIFAIYQATFLGKALIDRIVTISGNGIKEAKNLKMKIGTPVEEIKRYLEMKIDTQKIVIGGPMTGKTIYDENTVIWKNTGALLFLNKEEINVKKTEPCINCGICVDKCPMGLMPLKFEQFYFVEEFKEALEYNVFDCIECGVCTYVCPSNRPLLESIFLIKKKLKEVEYD